MTQERPEPVTSEPVAAAGLITGVPAVDDVLADVESLATRPVAEHVAVFEDAHARLRHALDSEATPHAG